MNQLAVGNHTMPQGQWNNPGEYGKMHHANPLKHSYIITLLSPEEWKASDLWPICQFQWICVATQQ